MNKQRSQRKLCNSLHAHYNKNPLLKIMPGATRWEGCRGQASANPARQAVFLEANKKKQGSWAKQLCRNQRENYSQDHVLNTILTMDFTWDPPQGWLSPGGPRLRPPHLI